MQRRAPVSPVLRIELSELRALANDWMLDGELQQFSAKTISKRRDILSKLFWFCDRENFADVGIRELKSFLLHLAEGHKEEKGRFGIAKLSEPLRPVSLRGWYVVFATFFRWCHTEGYLDCDLMQGVKKPRAQEEIKPPLAAEQILKLLEVAKKGMQPQRDTLLLLLLLDTGLRCSELVSLRVKDVDLSNRSLMVIGKGNKKRMAFLGRQSARALMLYLRATRYDKEEHLFFAHAGLNCGEPLTSHGLQQLLKRLKKRAGIDVACSPHALRRSFACAFLKSGGNVFALQALLGHSDLTMTRRYCKIVDSDIAEQHRRHSPVESLTR